MPDNNSGESFTSDQVIPVARLTGPYNLVEHLNAHILKDRVLKSDPSGFFHPSAASTIAIDPKTGKREVLGTCLRQAYYAMTDGDNRGPKEPYVMWSAKLGTGIEKMFTEMYKEMGVWVANNVRFHNKAHMISGELDNINKEPDGTEYLLENKTFYGYQATKEIIGNKWQAGKPKDSHLLQVLIYLYLFRDRFPYARMLYVSRENAKRKQFKITLDKDGDMYWPVVDGKRDSRFTVNDIFARFQELHGYIQRGEVPNREFELEYSTAKIEELFKAKAVSKTKYEMWKKGKTSVGDYQCSYCDFTKFCWGKEVVEPEEEEAVE